MKEVLTALIKPVLAHPEFLDIEEHKAAGLMMARISVHGADYGRVCGKSGRNLRALEALLEPINTKWKVRLMDPLTADRFLHIVPNPEWNPQPVIEMLQGWSKAAAFPGDIVLDPEPRNGGIYDIVFTGEPPPAELVDYLARWASTAAQAAGGKIHLAGARYAFQ